MPRTLDLLISLHAAALTALPNITDMVQGIPDATLARSFPILEEWVVAFRRHGHCLTLELLISPLIWIGRSVNVLFPSYGDPTVGAASGVGAHFLSLHSGLPATKRWLLKALRVGVKCLVVLRCVPRLQTTMTHACGSSGTGEQVC